MNRSFYNLSTMQRVVYSVRSLDVFFFCILLLGVSTIGCTSSRTSKRTRMTVQASPQTPPTRAIEVTPIELPLLGPCASEEMEFSGLTWVHDTLILLPQYPKRLAKHTQGDTGGLCTLTRAEIQHALKTRPVQPLTPRVVPMDTQGIESDLQGFEGFEAVAHIADNKAVLTIEAELPEHMEAWAVTATVNPDTGAMKVHPASRQLLKIQARWKNFAYEATTRNRASELLFLYEANGESANPDRHILRTNHALRMRMPMSLDPLECRVTDATDMDPTTGRFYVTNYCWSGNVDLIPGTDALVTRFGEGPSHVSTKRVERIVALDSDSTNVTIADASPIYLTLRPDGKERNWEGIVRLTGGFLIVTDQFPETILAFVPVPE